MAKKEKKRNKKKSPTRHCPKTSQVCHFLFLLRAVVNFSFSFFIFAPFIIYCHKQRGIRIKVNKNYTCKATRKDWCLGSDMAMTSQHKGKRWYLINILVIWLQWIKRLPEHHPSQIFWHLARGTWNWDYMHDRTLHNFQHQSSHQQLW